MPVTHIVPNMVFVIGTDRIKVLRKHVEESNEIWECQNETMNER